MKLSYILILLLAAGHFACTTTRKTSRLAAGIDTLFNSPTLAQHHVGFALYDPETKRMLHERQADHYFTPASNTKLFTFYAGLCVLGDSVPALRYSLRKSPLGASTLGASTLGDSLVIWGTGDPSLLHPDLPRSRVFDFLKSRPEKLVFSNQNSTQATYGPGWGWDNYSDEYQAELSSLPVYGNILRFKVDEARRWQPALAYFRRYLALDSSLSAVQRNLTTNLFRLPGVPATPNRVQDVPYLTSPELTVQLLADTLKKEVRLRNVPFDRTARTMHSVPVDTLYQRMLQVSDNMLAEHVMLLVSGVVSDTLSVPRGIAHVRKTFLADLPDQPNWVDGSGLSRYNLFTPRTMINLLEKISAKVPRERLFRLLAVGGLNGTLKNQYKGGAPFVFAKTGSLSGVYNLSGYLVAKSGKVLLFSFMNNNFLVPTAEVRRQVERVLRAVREEY
ncbi:MAG: D-alanyl-D-alanine carboxypeptidase [Cytophagaceae bacterium]|nr:D-alanyl-D-alanine carboxypeptidase [Cytophagaceae bacterium]